MSDKIVDISTYRKHRRPADRADDSKIEDLEDIWPDEPEEENKKEVPKMHTTQYKVMGKKFSLDDGTVESAMLLRGRYGDKGMDSAKTFEELYIAGMNWMFEDKLEEIGETDVRNVPWDKIKLWMLTIEGPGQKEKKPDEVDVPEDGSFMEYRLISLFAGYICQTIWDIGVYY
ncbi:hypothetical protein [Candidatus Weimeria sp. HCP3S3_B5]|uniref:hypothetical protein n=1 Tax=Candidatus Weimeria sp. HCP3S3_B5 TaxID=3438871 RepID=UPI003F88767D